MHSYRLDPGRFEPEVRFTRWTKGGTCREVLYENGMVSGPLGLLYPMATSCMFSFICGNFPEAVHSSKSLGLRSHSWISSARSTWTFQPCITRPLLAEVATDDMLESDAGGDTTQSGVFREKRKAISTI